MGVEGVGKQDKKGQLANPHEAGWEGFLSLVILEIPRKMRQTVNCVTNWWGGKTITMWIFGLSHCSRMDHLVVRPERRQSKETEVVGEDEETEAVGEKRPAYARTGLVQVTVKPRRQCQMQLVGPEKSGLQIIPSCILDLCYVFTWNTCYFSKHSSHCVCVLARLLTYFY